jgi:hypothetical protein
MTDKLDRVLEKLSEQAVQLARIEEQLKSEKSLTTELRADVADLKRWKWKAVGGITVLSFGAQYILKMMVK